MKYFMVALISIFIVQAHGKTDYGSLYPEANDTFTCTLEHLVNVSYTKGKFKRISKKEKATLSSVFTDLKSKNPKMIKPDKINLIKVKENNGVYWLLSKKGSSAVVMFVINTKEKIMIQQRSVNFSGLSFYGQSWMGKCI